MDEALVSAFSLDRAVSEALAGEEVPAALLETEDEDGLDVAMATAARS